MLKIKDIREELNRKLLAEEFTISDAGSKTVEIVGAHFLADEESIIGTPNHSYISHEIDWYNSQSLNVYDIKGKTPFIWKQVSDRLGNINSNYGWCIFSKENGEQYINVLRKLKQDKSTRQSIMIYNRPSMHIEWNKEGMSDFMCCQNQMYVIRNNKLSVVVNFRSNDARFGYLNDYAWTKYVLEKLLSDLRSCYVDLELGDIIWNAGSLHVYERDFNLLLT